jgi:hypothetical protein
MTSSIATAPGIAKASFGKVSSQFLAAAEPRRHSTKTSVSTKTIYAERFHPSERRVCAKLSVISGRSFHSPKNSEFASAPKVESRVGAEEETSSTISAGPVGTSFGSVMRNSRLGGISALRFRVFAITILLPTHPNDIKSLASRSICARQMRDQSRQFCGANGEGRTPMTLRPPDPKSGASANSATFACTGDSVASNLG